MLGTISFPKLIVYENMICLNLLLFVAQTEKQCASMMAVKKKAHAVDFNSQHHARYRDWTLARTIYTASTAITTDHHPEFPRRTIKQNPIPRNSSNRFSPQEYLGLIRWKRHGLFQLQRCCKRANKAEKAEKANETSRERGKSPGDGRSDTSIDGTSTTILWIRNILRRQGVQQMTQDRLREGSRDIRIMSGNPQLCRFECRSNNAISIQSIRYEDRISSRRS